MNATRTKVTPADTDTIFGFGNGVYSYPWWAVVDAHGTWEGDENPTQDDWWIKVEECDDDGPTGTEYYITYKILMRAVRKIASKEGLDHFSTGSRTRKHCQLLAFGKADETDFDADMADRVIQFALFGEVRYA